MTLDHITAHDGGMTGLQRFRYVTRLFDHGHVGGGAHGDAESGSPHVTDPAVATAAIRVFPDQNWRKRVGASAAEHHARRWQRRPGKPQAEGTPPGYRLSAHPRPPMPMPAIRD